MWTAHIQLYKHKVFYMNYPFFFKCLAVIVKNMKTKK